VDGGLAVIEGNIFAGNGSFDRGGALLIENSSPTVEGNQFQDNTGAYGAAICCVASASPHILENTIVNNNSLKWGGGIAVLTGSSTSIQNNFIDSNTAGSAGLPGSGGGILVWDNCDAEIRWNVISRNSASYGGAIENSTQSTTIVENNTFYGNNASTKGGCIGSLTGAVVTVRNCIIANSTGQPAIQCWDGGIVNVDCNDMWENTADYDGCGPGANDFYEDPMFCFPEFDDFQVDCTSPCLDHPVCGFAGALGSGCGSTRVMPTTWGAMKSLWK